jgi:Flp pilus assembly protein TadB
MRVLIFTLILVLLALALAILAVTVWPKASRTIRRRYAEADERSAQKVARLRTMKIWMELASKELRKAAAGDAFTTDFPPCPVCRGWVARFDSMNSTENFGVTFHPCGCSITVDRKTHEVATVGPDEDNH